MKRREFIVLLGGAAAAWPIRARAQQRGTPVIGFLNSGSPEQYRDRVRAFFEGLGRHGYIEGRNVTVEYRWALGRYDRLPELAADLVRRRVSVIATTGGNPAALAAKAATATIPIVFQVAVDPIEARLVTSLERPGGNVTGVTNLNLEVGPKRLELMHELSPNATDFALLVNPSSRFVAETLSRDMQPAARAFGKRLHIVRASTEREIDAAFAEIGRLRASALIISPDSFFTDRARELAALTLRHRVPAVHNREFAEAGGLMSYGGNLKEVYRRVGEYTGRILKGEAPANLPVQQAATVELVINLKAAKALGLDVPLSLLGRADELIE
jgi:putative tryptophan/tyrosine transport system substrate-binding protein